MELELIEEESVASASELHAKLAKERLPSGFLLFNHPKVSLVQHGHSEEKGTIVAASVEFEDDLTFKLFISNVQIENSTVSHITSSEKVKSVSKFMVPKSMLNARSATRL